MLQQKKVSYDSKKKKNENENLCTFFKKKKLMYLYSNQYGQGNIFTFSLKHVSILNFSF